MNVGSLTLPTIGEMIGGSPDQQAPQLKSPAPELAAVLSPGTQVLKQSKASGILGFLKAQYACGRSEHDAIARRATPRLCAATPPYCADIARNCALKKPTILRKKLRAMEPWAKRRG